MNHSPITAPDSLDQQNPESAHLCRQRVAGQPYQSNLFRHENGLGSRKTSPQHAKCPYFRQNRPVGPVKPHLRSAFSPAPAHQLAKPLPDKVKKPCLRSSRKRSPWYWSATLRTFAHCRAIDGILVPQNLTFAGTGRIRGPLNPLTFCPAATHRAPRTPSLNSPAQSHHVSRKASPCPAENPAW
jgi:hypothetical protein